MTNPVDDLEAAAVDRAYDEVRDTLRPATPEERASAWVRIADAAITQRKTAERERDELRETAQRASDVCCADAVTIGGLEDALDAAQATLAELRAGALLAIDAKRHGSMLDYELHVGLLLNALAGKAATGMPGDGVAVVETEAA